MSKKKTRSPGCAPADGRLLKGQGGYCDPPLHSRWQKGQSGNPAGRAKGSLNLATIANTLAEELAESISVQSSDGKRKLSKDRAFFKKLINDALTGDARDKRVLLDAMVRLGALNAPAEEGTGGEAIPGAAEALERHIQRAIRRRDLEDDAAEDDDEGEGSP